MSLTDFSLKNVVQKLLGGSALGLLLLGSQAHADPIKRTPLANSKAHILQAVTLSPEVETIYFSGLLPAPVNPAAATDQLKAEGNTQRQTEAVFKRLHDALAVQGLDFQDVIQLRIYLVADPTTGKLDFNGLQQAYTQFFGSSAQPNLPTRTTVGVASLVLPGALIEIEAIAARPVQSSTAAVTAPSATARPE